MKKLLKITTMVLVLMLCAKAALAAEASLPVKAKILQCGKRAELQQACDRDSRCCVLLEKVQQQQNLTQTSAGLRG